MFFLKEDSPGISRSSKKINFFARVLLGAQTIFFHGIFLKPTLLGLKSTNLAFVMTFLLSAVRYSPRKLEILKIVQKIAKITGNNGIKCVRELISHPTHFLVPKIEFLELDNVFGHSG